MFGSRGEWVCLCTEECLLLSTGRANSHAYQTLQACDIPTVFFTGLGYRAGRMVILKTSNTSTLHFDGSHFLWRGFL